MINSCRDLHQQARVNFENFISSFILFACIACTENFEATRSKNIKRLLKGKFEERGKNYNLLSFVGNLFAYCFRGSGCFTSRLGVISDFLFIKESNYSRVTRLNTVRVETRE